MLRDYIGQKLLCMCVVQCMLWVQHHATSMIDFDFANITGSFVDSWNRIDGFHQMNGYTRSKSLVCVNGNLNAALLKAD